MNATAIRYYCDPDSLADVPYSNFKSKLYNTLKSRWPGATINIVMGIGRSWGETAEGGEITADQLRQIGNDVFERMCAKANA